MTFQLLMVITSATLVMGQRPGFAGSRPIGYPELYNRTTTTADGLEDRFGEGTTQRLPIEANGDRDLIDRLSKLPIDKQPFWFINWQAIEANRENPQTYPQKPNVFIDPIPINNQPNSPNSPIQGSTSQNPTNIGSTQNSVSLSMRNGEPNVPNTAPISLNNGQTISQIPTTPRPDSFNNQNSSKDNNLYKQNSSHLASNGSYSEISNTNSPISTTYTNVNV